MTNHIELNHLIQTKNKTVAILTNDLSWEALIESGYEESIEDPAMHQLEVKMELEDVCKMIDAKNPLYTKAIVLSEYYDLSVSQIAREMNESEENIRFYLNEAKKIGKEYKDKNG